jgi:hypothetical protein
LVKGKKMKNYAWINTETELVENVIFYDGVTEITIPSNIILIELPVGLIGEWSGVGIGWKYIMDKFIEPPQPTPSTTPTPPTTIGGAPYVIA